MYYSLLLTWGGKMSPHCLLYQIITIFAYH
nr:MAG TPA: hypothetical protein [Caudoviricetes sp.]